VRQFPVRADARKPRPVADQATVGWPATVNVLFLPEFDRRDRNPDQLREPAARCSISTASSSKFIVYALYSLEDGAVDTVERLTDRIDVEKATRLLAYPPAELQARSPGSKRSTGTCARPSGAVVAAVEHDGFLGLCGGAQRGAGRQANGVSSPACGISAAAYALRRSHPANDTAMLLQVLHEKKYPGGRTKPRSERGRPERGAVAAHRPGSLS
jgi:hypothetical protein